MGEQRAKPIDRKRRRRMTYLWVVAMAVIIIALVRSGQEALLYVLATISVTVLLVIVARADLGGSGEVSHRLPSGEAPIATVVEPKPAATARATHNKRRR